MFYTERHVKWYMLKLKFCEKKGKRKKGRKRKAMKVYELSLYNMARHVSHVIVHFIRVEI